MFANRYFSPRFFPARYFAGPAQAGSGPSTAARVPTPWLWVGFGAVE